MLVLFAIFFIGRWAYQNSSETNTDDVNFKHREIDPDVLPVGADTDKHPSETLQETAEYAKEQSLFPPSAVTTPPPISLANQAAQTPYQQQPVQNAQPIYEPAQILQQRSPLLDVENPIIEPTQQAQDVDIPDRNIPSLTDDKSDYGVRYATNSPNRGLRDKRYKRNSSN
jgi:hypothetical protein